MLFDGKYLNGEKWSGIINEYYENRNLKFEGELINGKKNRKSKEYYESGTLKYEGGYLNGERSYFGKEYYENGSLKYDGAFENGKKHGEGKEYYENKALKFAGIYLNGNMWKGKGFDKKTKKEYKVVDGKGFENETFDDFVLLKYEDEKKTAKKKVEKKIVETPKLKSGKGGEFYETGEKKFEGDI